MNKNAQAWLDSCLAGTTPDPAALSVEYEHLEDIRKALIDAGWQSDGTDIDLGKYTGRGRRHSQTKYRFYLLSADKKMRVTITKTRTTKWIGYLSCKPTHFT